MCGADFVNPVDWEPVGETHWWMLMRCGACDTWREATVTNAVAARFDLELDRRMDILAARVGEDRHGRHGRRGGDDDPGAAARAHRRRRLRTLNAVLGVALTAAALAGCPLFPADFTDQPARRPRCPWPRTRTRSCARSGSTTTCTPTSARAAGRAGRSASRTRWSSRRTKRSRVSFDYADESDRVRYPIPRGVRIEGGGDRHALLVDRSRCRLYELFALRRENGRWHAGSGAVVEPAAAEAAPGGLDVGRRRRPADPAAARAPGEDRPRAARDRLALAPRVRLAGAPLRVRRRGPVAAADGRAAAAEGERRHLAASRARRAGSRGR